MPASRLSAGPLLYFVPVRVCACACGRAHVLSWCDAASVTRVPLRAGVWLATNVLCSLPHVLSNRRAHAATTHTRLRLAVCVALLAAPAPHSRQLLRAPVQYSACRGCCGVCGAKRGVLVEGGASPRQQGARGNGGGVVGTREQGRGRGISKGGAAALAREGLPH